jgi:TolB protein
MEMLRRIAPVALLALASLAAVGCSTTDGAEDTVGRPPVEGDKRIPTKSSTEDIKSLSNPDEEPQKAPPKEEVKPKAEVKPEPPAPVMGADMRFAGEERITNLKKLTAGGQNAEAYFSFDGSLLSFQSTRDGAGCDRIYTMKLDGSEVTPISDGKGVTTCAYFYPKGDKVLYASTHLEMEACPPKLDFQKYGGYVWPIHKEYEIFAKTLKDGKLQQLTKSPGYDAEATISPKGDRVVFTSMRDGDLELYTMKLDGTGVKRLTNAPGYDGGAFFSADGKKIVYRAYHPKNDAELADYKKLLAEGVVRPSVMELFIMDADGKNQRQLTYYNAASFAPYFHPSGEQIVFSSNFNDPKGRNFDLYMINTDGSGLQQLTFNPSFDSFPMFSPDGKKLVFSSNRAGSAPGETNVFVADWK